MDNNQDMVFHEHEIEWDDTKVSRLWNYYSRTPPYSEIYFSKLFGHHILRKRGLPLEESLEVLDFGCGPGFIWDHLMQMGAHWRYTALDFSPDSVKQFIERAKGHEQFCGAIQATSLPVALTELYFDVMFHEFQHVRSWSVSSLRDRLKKHGLGLRMAETLDLTAQDFTALSIIRKVKRIAQRFMNKIQSKPHMIAVFQKT